MPSKRPNPSKLREFRESMAAQMRALKNRFEINKEYPYSAKGVRITREGDKIHAHDRGGRHLESEHLEASGPEITIVDRRSGQVEHVIADRRKEQRRQRTEAPKYDYERRIKGERRGTNENRTDRPTKPEDRVGEPPGWRKLVEIDRRIQKGKKVRGSR